MAMTPLERVQKTRAIRKADGLCVSCGAASKDDPRHIKHLAANAKWARSRSKKERRQSRLTEYASRQSKKARFRSRAASIKTFLGCEVCQEDHPACLDFHHRDPKTKGCNIAKMIGSDAPWVKIQAEIDKCAVLCSNCHRKQHYEAKTGAWEKRKAVA